MLLPRPLHTHTSMSACDALCYRNLFCLRSVYVCCAFCYPFMYVVPVQESAPFLRVLGGYPMDLELGMVDPHHPAAFKSCR